jgi:hypothetical protein
MRTIDIEEGTFKDLVELYDKMSMFYPVKTPNDVIAKLISVYYGNEL